MFPSENAMTTPLTPKDRKSPGSVKLSGVDSCKKAPYSHPFDAYWFGFYDGPLGDKQIELCHASEWQAEFRRWILDQGFYWTETDSFPHRFIIGKTEPETRTRCDLSRREFSRIQKQFEFLINKYGFCLSGILTYCRQRPGKPYESYPVVYQRSRVRDGDSIKSPNRRGRPPRSEKIDIGGTPATMMGFFHEIWGGFIFSSASVSEGHRHSAIMTFHTFC
jgi:hypothetical protein